MSSVVPTIYFTDIIDYFVRLYKKLHCLFLFLFVFTFIILPVKSLVGLYSYMLFICTWILVYGTFLIFFMQQIIQYRAVKARLVSQNLSNIVSNVTWFSFVHVASQYTFSPLSSFLLCAFVTSF